MPLQLHLYSVHFPVTKKAMKFDSSGTELYVGACKMLNQVPVSYYLRQRDKDTMRMRHHSLGKIAADKFSLNQQPPEAVTYESHYNS